MESARKLFLANWSRSELSGSIYTKDILSNLLSQLSLHGSLPHPQGSKEEPDMSVFPKYMLKMCCHQSSYVESFLQLSHCTAGKYLNSVPWL